MKESFIFPSDLNCFKSTRFFIFYLQNNVKIIGLSFYEEPSEMGDKKVRYMNEHHLGAIPYQGQDLFDIKEDYVSCMDFVV